MDYMKFVEYHREQNADITVGCLPVDYERASDFGLMNIDDQGVVTVRACPWCTLGPCDARNELHLCYPDADIATLSRHGCSHDCCPALSSVA